jgi:hypothetical protein
LEDESFSVMATPQWYPGSDYDYKESRLAEVHGELALARLNEDAVEIWMFEDADGVNPPQWVRHHVLINLQPYQSCIPLISAFDLQDILYYLSRQTSEEGSKLMVGMETLKYRSPDTGTLECPSTTFSRFDVIPYIPTLVPI